MINSLILCDLDTTLLDTLRKQLKEGRLYLHGEYRNSLQLESQVYDYSAIFALSDSDSKSLQRIQTIPPCYRATNALKLEATFKEIQQLYAANASNVRVFNANEQEIYKGILTSSIESIEELKRHYVRAFFTAQTKRQILENLNPNEALITIDFAQKMLPKYFLEEQSVSRLTSNPVSILYFSNISANEEFRITSCTHT